MTLYEQLALRELQTWQEAMQRGPSWLNRASKSTQQRLNRLWPEAFHQTLTTITRQLTRGVLFASEVTSGPVPLFSTFEARELAVRRRIDFYKKAASAEGGVTGAGGFLLGLVDFPVLLGLKIKLLFEIAGLYGYRVEEYRERLFLLHIFQLAFSSQQHRRAVYERIRDWDRTALLLPDDPNQFDWRRFQEEYRDYIDLVKLAQLVPGIGAAVGLVANYRLISQLGKTAMNAYRMRWAAGLAPAAQQINAPQ
jgi:hypothetical protein